MLLVCGMLCPAAFAQTASVPLNQYTMRCYGVDDGLPQNSVTDLAINTDGQLIVATYSGVVVFDGHRFSNLIPQTSKPFPNVEAFTLAVDHNGVIWIGTTSSGLYRVDGPDLMHWDMNNGLNSHIIRKIKVVDDGVLVNSDGRVLFFAYNREPQLNPLITSPNHLFLEKFKGLNTRIIAVNDPGSDHSTGYAVKTDAGQGDGSYYLAENGQVFSVSQGNKHLLIEDFNTATPVSIYHMMSDSHDNLWISTIKNGLFRYGSFGLESFELLSTNRFSSAVEDVDGAIWVGTSTGLCSLTLGAIKNFGTEQGLFKENIKSLATDHQNKVYAIPYGKNTQIVTIQNNQVSNQPLGLSTPGVSIHQATTDKKGQIWVVTDDYIGQLTAEKIIPVIRLEAKTKVLISHDRALWYQENNNLIQFKDQQKTYHPIQQNTPVDIRSLSIGVHGDVLIGEKHNYYRLSGNTLHKIEIPIGISSCLREFVEDELWGCSDGLWLRTHSKNHQFDYKNALTSVVNGHIHDGRQDHQGNLWATANSGLFRLLRTDLDDYLAGKNPVPQFVKFAEQDNLKSSEFNSSSASSVVTQDGKLWFASQGGVVNVLPDLVFPQSDKLLKPLIEQLVISEQHITLNDLNAISPNPKAIEIQFGAVFLSDNKNIKFRHKLLPLHDDWHQGRTAHLSELGPGTYQLILQARYNNNPWSASFTKQLTVMPAWYQTWWFRVLFVLLVLVLLIGIPQWRIKRLTKNRNELEKLVGDQTESLLLANQQLDRLSRIDELTQIPNRREFINNINQLCEDPGASFSLALTDIDDFKAYNDHYGHIAGDECLRAVAKVINSFCNESILVARFGGEEFVVLFDHTNLNQAHHILQQIHQAIADQQLVHNQSSVNGLITLSSGVVSRKGNESVESIIDRADQAMYQAKTQGKDQIIVKNN